MKFVFVIPSWSYRGGEKIFINLAETLTQNGHEVVVVAGRKDEKNARKAKGIKIVYPKRSNFLLQNDLFYFFFAWICLLFTVISLNQKFDYVITESNQCLWGSVLYSVFKKTKVVWYVMAYESRHYTSPIRNLLYELTFGFVERLCVLRVSRIFILAPRVGREIAKRYKLEYTVLNPVICKTGFDLLRVNSEIKKMVSKGKILFLPAAFHWKKNQVLAIKVTAKLKDFYLILAGGGKDEKKLRSLVSGLGITDRVYFAGVIKDDDLNYLYKKSFLTLVCSLNDNEGLSLTALEALREGGEVLVSEHAGVAEILIKNHSGIVKRPVVSEFIKGITEAGNKKIENLTWLKNNFSSRHVAQTVLRNLSQEDRIKVQ